MSESHIAESLLTDTGLGKIASLIKWLIGCLISFALILSTLAIQVSNDITGLKAQTQTYQQGTNIRLDRIESRQDSR